MKSIKHDIFSELVINKSIFYNYLFKVNTVEEVTTKLDELRSKHSDANHHCTAYIIGKNQEIQKYNDDGEPSKTAGMPMIEVLKKHDLTNILAVSVRYFGGIKLGAGGLVRAYTKGVAHNVKEIEFSNLIEYTTVSVIIPFDQIGNIEKYIRDHFEILDTVYSNEVTYIFNIKSKEYDSLERTVSDNTKGIGQLIKLDTFETYE